MLRHVLFDLSLFPSEDERPSSQKRILALLQALTYCNQLYLREHPETPLIYQSGIKYIVPEQFEKAELPEVATVRDYLKKKGASDDVMAAFIAMADQLGSGEHFRDVPRIIENGGGDCFPLSQKIIVRSRSTGQYELISIGDLRHVYPAYEALSYNFSTCKQEFKPIIGFVDKGIRPVSRARLSNGTDLIATDDHKFWTLDGSGANRRRLGVRTMGEYVEAMKMSRGKRTARSRILMASRIPALGTAHPTSAEAYLAGIFAAEGNCEGKKHTCIAQHKGWVREKIEATLCEVGTSFRYQPGYGKTPGSGAAYYLHGGASNPIVAMMREQGEDSFDKRFPQAFLSGDQETVARLLEGHGDGDAWRPANGNFKRPGVEAIYGTSSDELMEQIRLGLLITGRNTYTYLQKDHQGEGDSPIWRIHEYNDVATKLRSRVEMLEDDLPGLKYGTVRNAAPFGTAHVGCIEVEGNHNFFLADGTLVSNCDNVAAWRAAELRELGINARPYITWRKRPDGGVTYHVVVLYGDGTHEDPSLLLGMGGEGRAADKAEEERKLAERCATFVNRLCQTGKVKETAETVFGAPAATPFSAQGSTENYNQLQYTIPFQTDDSYEAWSPTRPQAYYADPRYASGLIQQSGPIFNTRMRDVDDLEDDFDDRFDGFPSKKRARKRHAKKR